MENTEQFILLNETHLPQIAQLYKSTFSGEPWKEDWSDEQLMAYIREVSCAFNSLNYGLLLEGELAAATLGAVRHWWEGMTYCVEEFFVLPELQGRGVGTRFLALVEEDVRKRGIIGICLQTDNDKPAYGFYRKNGFQEITEHVSMFKSTSERS